eukprot:132646-Pelagomonas_calceolata.AAC.4
MTLESSLFELVGPHSRLRHCCFSPLPNVAIHAFGLTCRQTFQLHWAKHYWPGLPSARALAVPFFLKLPHPQPQYHHVRRRPSNRVAENPISCWKLFEETARCPETGSASITWPILIRDERYEIKPASLGKAAPLPLLTNLNFTIRDSKRLHSCGGGGGGGGGAAAAASRGCRYVHQHIKLKSAYSYRILRASVGKEAATLLQVPPHLDAPSKGRIRSGRT